MSIARVTTLLLLVGCGAGQGQGAAPDGGGPTVDAGAPDDAGAGDAADWTQLAGDGLTHGHVAGVSRYEYVIVPVGAFLYDMDTGHRFVGRLDVPDLGGQAIVGVTMSPATGTLFIAFGGDGGEAGNGSVLAYDLVHDSVRWRRDYDHGTESLAVSLDGSTLFVPEGQRSATSRWFVVEADEGEEIGSIASGTGATHTIAGLGGERVYLGARYWQGIAVADEESRQVVGQVWPLWGGAMPFTVNGRETLVFATSNGFLGFQVGDLATGAVVHDVTVPGFVSPPGWPNTPSNGITLSPDEQELYLLDQPNAMVHVFDLRGLPAGAPVKVADVPVTPLAGDESPCFFDCGRYGWLQHSLDGRFVFVGDSGDVIDTGTRAVVANLPALRNSRICLEIDWYQGTPIATSTRYGLGYVR